MTFVNTIAGIHDRRQTESRLAVSGHFLQLIHGQQFRAVYIKPWVFAAIRNKPGQAVDFRFIC